MTRPRFSIITPTYNPGQRVEETIKSVLAQKNELFEYIIVDGCSTDETLNIIRKYEGRIKWSSQRDCGVYDAMNRGIRMAAGDYLYFLGAGDRLRENILEKVEKTIPDGHLIFIYGNVFLLDKKRKYLGKFDEAKIARANICHQAIFYERTIFDVIGTYDLRYSLLADHDLNLRCFGDKRIRKIYVDEVIADYEGGGISMGKDLNFIKDAPRIIRENLGPKGYLFNRLYWLLRRIHY